MGKYPYEYYQMSDKNIHFENGVNEIFIIYKGA